MGNKSKQPFQNLAWERAESESQMLLNHLWNLVCEYLPNGGLVVTELYDASDAVIQKLMNSAVLNYLASRVFDGPGLLQLGMSLMEELLLVMKLSDGFLGGSFVTSLLLDKLNASEELPFFDSYSNRALANWLFLLDSRFKYVPEKQQAFNVLRRSLNLSAGAVYHNPIRRSPHNAISFRMKDQNDYLYNANVDIFKMTWNGSIIFGCLLASQTLLPVHSDFREFVNDLKLRKIGFRARTKIYVHQ